MKLLLALAAPVFVLGSPFGCFCSSLGEACGYGCTSQLTCVNNQCENSYGEYRTCAPCKKCDSPRSTVCGTKCTDLDEICVNGVAMKNTCENQLSACGGGTPNCTYGTYASYELPNGESCDGEMVANYNYKCELGSDTCQSLKGCAGIVAVTSTCGNGAATSDASAFLVLTVVAAALLVALG